MVMTGSQENKSQGNPFRECVRVTDNFARRLHLCLQRQGGPLEHNFGESIKAGLFDLQMETLWNDRARTEVNVNQI